MSVERRYSLIRHEHTLQDLQDWGLLPTSGDHWGKIPYVMDDGVMEIGKYLDFHETDTHAGDYDYRLTVTSGVLGGSGNIDAPALLESGASLVSKYARLASANTFLAAQHISTTGSHFNMYETDAADTADRCMFEINANSVNLYGYDNSATAFRRALAYNITSGDLTLNGFSNGGRTYISRTTQLPVVIYGDTSVTDNVSGDATVTYSRWYCNGGGTLRGYVYGNTLGFGLLTSAGGWGVQCSPSHILLNNPLQLGAQTTATTATAGARTLPANPVDFLVVVINGTSRKIPYYAT